MGKLFTFVLAVIVVALVATNVVEVKFHPEKYTTLLALAKLPGGDRLTMEKGKAAIVTLKRWVELSLIRDDERRLVVTLLYVKDDAQRLKDLTEQGWEAAELSPAVQQLITSIERVRSTAEKTPAEIVAKQKAESEQSFAVAQQALAALQSKYKQYSEQYNDFVGLTKSLEQQVGRLGNTGEMLGASDVAGTEQQK